MGGFNYENYQTVGIFESSHLIQTSVDQEAIHG
jgi:hypothetical protein